MDTELEQQPWYKEYSKDDKILLARLIKAQSDQGDNKPLKIETIESGLFPDPSIANILAPYDQSNQDLSIQMHALPEIDEAEIDKMILDKKERDFKARLWQNLNIEWLKTQNKKKRDLKAQAKKIKQKQIGSSIAPSQISEGEPPEDSHINIVPPILDNQSLNNESSEEDLKNQGKQKVMS